MAEQGERHVVRQQMGDAPPHGRQHRRVAGQAGDYDRTADARAPDPAKRRSLAAERGAAIVEVQRHGLLH